MHEYIKNNNLNYINDKSNTNQIGIAKLNTNDAFRNVKITSDLSLDIIYRIWHKNLDNLGHT